MLCMLCTVTCPSAFQYNRLGSIRTKSTFTFHKLNHSQWHYYSTWPTSMHFSCFWGQLLIRLDFRHQSRVRRGLCYIQGCRIYQASHFFLNYLVAFCSACSTESTTTHLAFLRSNKIKKKKISRSFVCRSPKIFFSQYYEPYLKVPWL